jgi:chemotaxis protein methyltransferase CheR
MGSGVSSAITRYDARLLGGAGQIAYTVHRPLRVHGGALTEQHGGDELRYQHLVFKGVQRHGVVRRPAPRRVMPVTPLNLPRAESEIERISPSALFLLRRIFELAGLDMGRYRLAPLTRRLPACLRAVGAATPEAAAEIVSRDPARLMAAVNALVLGVTEFFRDGPVFEQLRDEVIPRLLARTSHPRVWSAGCSDGSELYSLAMLFAEQGALEGAEFHGTDCRPAAIATARAGSYSPQMLAGVPADLVEKYCYTREKSCMICMDLKAAVRWEVADVFADAAMGRWDLIVCRNLAIYLHAAAAHALWKKLAQALSPGAVLVVGKAERPVVSGLQRLAPCIFVKE